jgi:hypothetical protein
MVFGENFGVAAAGSPTCMAHEHAIRDPATGVCVLLSGQHLVLITDLNLWC